MSSYIPIASQTLSTAATSVTFSSIPTTLNSKTLRDLIIVTEFTSNNFAALNMRANGTGGGFYLFAQGNGSALSTQNGYVAPVEIAANVFSTTSPSMNSIIQIFDYAQTNKTKPYLNRANLASGTYSGVVMTVGSFDTSSSTAITSVTLSFGGGQTFQAGSTFNLFGIEG